MNIAALLITFACGLVFLSLADQISTAPRIERHRDQLAVSKVSSEPAANLKTTGTQVTARETVKLDAKVDSNWRQAMLEDVNSKRNETGLPPLILSEPLNAMSQNHSDYQVSIKKMTHDDASGSLGKRATDAGISWSRIAENVAMGAETVDNVMNLWENSPHHLANILGNYKFVGFGLATDGEGNKGSAYWTQTFVYPL
ncbi:hypothetical protein GGI01_000046 [Coemansia sp. RSA 376]|nr:hypothetical protein LPJ71_000215 [Coemansia sp. S17]KAJ2035063.1 hypothetical protein H4S03_004564 [Coemansia sp. S3946]KAJ2110480.1 hypothetical protein GGI16_000281 [Coemansia sp. S142-1]KAJ2264199.1 hypothetical protein GGI01_000046 [Coemansia sp. RSA 376]KAJ2353850.1 hypothetical protein GGH92_000396 [Coemansia sp. RSA 2673]KAJ2432318.1 hypothetical protein GGF41_000040 [Coemansia sp. RSA 2531]KAJ2469872.1 hypothetical protein GGI03_000010 [Coemansia sp. RSA 2337]